MDLTSSRNSNSPTTRRAVEKPPFRLCFSKNRLPGRSSAYVPKVDGDLITPKFYSKEYENASYLNANDTLERGTIQESSGDAHCRPLLTSRAYGWWYEQGIEPVEPCLNFRKKTSDLVNFQLKIYAEDRKLKGLNY